MRLSYESTDRLSRSPDGYVAGICEGLGRRFGIEPVILRIIWVAAVILGFGSGLVVYALLWFILPRADARPIEPAIWRQRDDGTRYAPFARTGVDRKLLGVCGGLARRWGFDPSIVRLGAVGVLGASAGLAVIAYLVLAIAMPGPEAATSTQKPVES
jgi:phage shock protein C